MSRLVVPDLVEQRLIEALTAPGAPARPGVWAHDEHLARLERQLGLDPATVLRLAAADVLKAGVGLPLPWVQLSLDTTGEVLRTTEPDGRDVLAMRWTLEVQVADLGRDPHDAKQRARWQTMTVAECLLQRTARGDLIEDLALTRVDLDSEQDGDDAYIGRGELTFAVLVPDAVTVRGRGVLPPHDHAPPAGGPGGRPADPYAPPTPWPPVTHVDTDLDLDPIPPEEQT